jgi:hypothetical protein
MIVAGRDVMRPREFLAAVRDAATAALPDALRAFHVRLASGMVQLHFGNPRVHYEVWLVRTTGRIEIGLHFEGEREDNARAAALLADHAHAIRALVGDDAELEQWTAAWTRLHVTLPPAPLTDALSRETARRLACLMVATAPLLSSCLTRPWPRSRTASRLRRGRRGAAATAAG